MYKSILALGLATASLNGASCDTFAGTQIEKEDTWKATPYVGLCYGSEANTGYKWRYSFKSNFYNFFSSDLKFGYLFDYAENLKWGPSFSLGSLSSSTYEIGDATSFVKLGIEGSCGFKNWKLGAQVDAAMDTHKVKCFPTDQEDAFVQLIVDPEATFSFSTKAEYNLAERVPFSLGLGGCYNLDRRTFVPSFDVSIQYKF